MRFLVTVKLLPVLVLNLETVKLVTAWCSYDDSGGGLLSL